MILVDAEIKAAIARGDVAIMPSPMASQFQPNSVDLTLGFNIIRYKWPSWWRRLLGRVPMIRPRMDKVKFDVITEKQDLSQCNTLVVKPGEFFLIDTLESLRIAPGSCLCVQLGGKSSMGRIFFFVHVTAGFFDAGWDGRPTLECYYLGPYPLILYPGHDKICQIQFWRSERPPDRPYGSTGLHSRYQGSEATTL